MSVIHVNRVTPQKLIRHGQRWVLEIERFVPIDRDIFDPVLSYVSGADNISAYLDDLGEDPSVVSSAAQILGQSPPDGACFELDEGRWMPAGPGLLPTSRMSTEGSSPTPTDTDVPDDLRGDLESIVRQFARLEERLTYLETQIAGKLPSNDTSPSVRPLNHEDNVPHSSTG